MNWSPSAALSNLRQRAAFLAGIRQFFAKRNVLEVETPLLSHATVTDPCIISIPAAFKKIGSVDEKTVYLQTSPEYAMKRLLAAGIGPIYQITKAFRQGEIGKYHNPEFSMLEWYRPGFDHHALMNEVDEFFQELLNTLPAERWSYKSVFEKWIGIDPHQISTEELMSCLDQHSIHYPAQERNTCLDLLLTHCIEPHLGNDRPVFLYDFPASQAALAKVRAENPPVASRFEVYFKGVELGNGFHELLDAQEQRQRFEKDLAYRAAQGIFAVPLDLRFLAALQHGMPDCAGIAIGVDRLLMLALEQKKIADVISFAFEEA